MRVYRARQKRRIAWLWLFIALALVVVGAVVYVIISRTVIVPGVTERIYPIHYRETIAGVAERYEVDPYLIAAVARTESGYDPEAVSHAGAVGLMQLLPSTAEWIVGLDGWQGSGDPDLTDPVDSLELGTCYLAFLLRRFDGDERAAIAAYNAGQGVVGEWLVSAEGDSLDLQEIPFSETREFVRRVEETIALYRQVHPGVFEEGAG